MSAGAAIAAEIAGALAEVGIAMGDGPLICTLRRSAAGPATPWDQAAAGDPDLHEVVAMRGVRKVKDGSGAETARARQVLKVGAMGVEPRAQDHIAIGVPRADVGHDTEWVEITEVRTSQPGGVPLSYEITLSEG